MGKIVLQNLCCTWDDFCVSKH